MHLVGRHRRVQSLARLAPGLPVGIAPLVAGQPDDHGTGGRRRLLGEAHRIAFQRLQGAARAEDLVFVDRAKGHAGDEYLPHARFDALAHRMPAAVPLIELAHHADALGVRRPHHEGDPVDAVDLGRVRAQPLVDLAMAALGEQVDVEVAQHRREPIGVLRLPCRAIAAEPQGIGETVGPVRHRSGEEAVGMQLGEVGHDVAAAAVDDADRVGAGPEHPHRAGMARFPACRGPRRGRRGARRRSPRWRLRRVSSCRCRRCWWRRS